jgi:hypothetical protein
VPVPALKATPPPSRARRGPAANRGLAPASRSRRAQRTRTSARCCGEAHASSAPSRSDRCNRALTGMGASAPPDHSAALAEARRGCYRHGGTRAVTVTHVVCSGQTLAGPLPGGSPGAIRHTRGGHLARIIHGLPWRERRECRRFGALGPEADAGVLEQYVEEAGGRRSRRCGALDARSRELMNNPG